MVFSIFLQRKTLFVFFHFFFVDSLIQNLNKFILRAKKKQKKVLSRSFQLVKEKIIKKFNLIICRENF